MASQTETYMSIAKNFFPVYRDHGRNPDLLTYIYGTGTQDHILKTSFCVFIYSLNLDPLI